MGADQQHDWRAIAANAIDWWRDAGVDVLVDDVPRDWMARTAPPPAPVAAEAPPPAPAFPATLDAFVAWRLGDRAPEAGRGIPLAPAGDPGAPLMIVVDCPDGEALIDGAAGRLFDRMLAAIGRDRASVYLASLTTVRPLTGRITPEAAAILAPIVRHHVALAAPRAVLALGAAASRALIGTDATPPRENLQRVNLESGTVAVVASRHPRFLLEHPAAKAEAWRDLQLLMGELR